MRWMLVLSLLVTGCIDLDALDSDPPDHLGETVFVHVTSPVGFNFLQVEWPAFGGDFRQATAGALQVTDYGWSHHDAVIGDGPHSLSFSALADQVVVATGALTNIEYKASDDPQLIETSANLSITLTPVTP